MIKFPFPATWMLWGSSIEVRPPMTRLVLPAFNCTFTCRVTCARLRKTVTSVILELAFWAGWANPWKTVIHNARAEIVLIYSFIVKIHLVARIHKSDANLFSLHSFLHRLRSHSRKFYFRTVGSYHLN